MRSLLLLFAPILLFVPTSQKPPVSDGDSPVAVLSFEWSKSRQTPEKSTGPASPAQPATQNRNFERQRRAQAPAGERDPYDDSVERRGAELERIVQESRSGNPVDGFTFRVKVRNASSKVIQSLIWEYQFTELLNPANVSSRQFLCGATLKPEKGAEFRVFSTTGPSNVISVASLANKSGDLFKQTALIDFIEFTDGSLWQRKDWNSDAARRAFENRGPTERVSTQCIGL